MMKILKTKVGRRSFLKTSAAAGGGLMISFSWLASCSDTVTEEQVLSMPDEWFTLNAYLQIGENGTTKIYCPNPEFGQNIKTAMPMIVAEELDMDWNQVVVEMAPFNTTLYNRQFTGGSQGIRRAWSPLRMAGATAKHMLKQAAANAWKVPAEEITTNNARLEHKASGKSAGYGEFAQAAARLEAPGEVALKDVSTFDIIGQSKKNVDGKDIVTGKPTFSMDIKKPGMLTSMIVHPPAFGLALKSFNPESIKSMPGIVDVFSFKTYSEEFARNYFDTNTFPELVAIVGNSTWEVMNAKKALEAEWEKFSSQSFKMGGRGEQVTINVPPGLESSNEHLAAMRKRASEPASLLRKDGDPEKAFANAATVIERTYTAPFLAHNMMEPVNCVADVTSDRAIIYAPTQAPEFIESTIAERIGLPVDQIEIEMKRMGGGFGRKAYCHYMVEAAVISQKMKKPVRLMYTREDDMTFGIYRPMYMATYRAALDENNNMIAYHVNAGGIPESPLGWAANRFPAGAVDNYLAEEWDVKSNITIGAFRAPRSNFLGGVEQSFLDEVAEAAGKDPIQFRLDLLERSKINPVGENNDYEPDRYAGVLKLVRDKSNWGQSGTDGTHRGVAAYFCHNSYAAHVVDMKIVNGQPKVENVTCAMDCGIVINPDAAANMAEGAIVDGIGNAFFGEMTFRDGVPEKTNFHKYRMIRMNEAPKTIDVHFVKNDIDPTGLGEPPFPPIFGAVANAMYNATDKRQYDQPFLGKKQIKYG